MTPTPTETAQEREERLAYEGAEKAYRTFVAEYYRVVQSTFSPRPSPVMRETADGPYLKAYADFMEIRRKKQLKADGSVRIEYIRRIAYEPSEVLLEACEDGSDVRGINRKGEEQGRGIVSTLELTVVRATSGWKVHDAEQVEVSSCS